MAGHIINFQGGWTHISCPNIYCYKGLTFEMHNYCGPARCNKDGELSKVGMGRKFWKIFKQWDKLSPSKKKRTLIFS
jgi:hypothetical protein